MLILITDTSGKQGSVALARAYDDPDGVQVIESAPLTGGTFSAQLVPQIGSLLEKHQLSKSDIGAFVVVAGPGSFTGLRVGLAAIKALSEILNKPIVPVSLLEVVALAACVRGKVLAALNAGRGEFYAGEYEIAGSAAQLLRERLISKDDVMSGARGFVISTPDAALGETAHAAGIPVSLIENITAAMIARLGVRKLSKGATVSPEQLEANYGRRSDAEIFAKPNAQLIHP
jgi:tRNA threonylcarbamoyladenosine biosynthesis protein TsaB